MAPSSNKILSRFLWILLWGIQLDPRLARAHPEDEFSYQDWVFAPSKEHFEIRLTFHCGGPLTTRLLDMVQADPSKPISQEQTLNMWQDLLGKKNPISVKAGNLCAYLSESSTINEIRALRKFAPIPNTEAQRQMFHWVCREMVSRVHLFRWPHASQKKFITPIKAQNKKQNDINFRFYKGSDQSQRICFELIYYFNWPESKSLEQGLTFTMDTNLVGISSGSTWRVDPPPEAEKNFIFEPQALNSQTFDPGKSIVGEKPTLPKIRRTLFFAAFLPGKETERHPQEQTTP